MRLVWLGVGTVVIALLLAVTGALIVGRLPWAAGETSSARLPVNNEVVGPQFVRLMDDAGEDTNTIAGRERFVASDGIAFDNWEIFLTDRMTGRVRQLTEDFATDRFPVLSPDASQVAFVSWRDGNSEIYVIDLSDGIVRNISHSPGRDLLPAWSPDGSMLAFVTHREGNYDIYLADVRHGLLHNLTHNPADDSNPQWSTDGGSITYKSYHAGGWSEFRQTLDGRPRVQTAFYAYASDE